MKLPSLDTYAQLIRQCMFSELDARIRAGKLFIEAKDNYPGEFMRWCRVEFSYITHATITNYMALATLSESRPDLIKNGHDLSVLYQLGKADETLVSLVEMADRQGVKIDSDLVTKFRNVPPYLRHMYQEANGRIESMLNTADALDDAPVEVVDICRRFNVPIQDTVQFLTSKYIKGSESFTEIAETGELNGIGWSVNLHDATKHDLRRYNQDRAEMHREENMPVYGIFRCAADVTSNGLNIHMPDDLFVELQNKSVFVTIRYAIVRGD